MDGRVYKIYRYYVRNKRRIQIIKQKGENKNVQNDYIQTDIGITLYSVVTNIVDWLDIRRIEQIFCTVVRTRRFILGARYRRNKIQNSLSPTRRKRRPSYPKRQHPIGWQIDNCIETHVYFGGCNTFHPRQKFIFHN